MSTKEEEIKIKDVTFLLISLIILPFAWQFCLHTFRYIDYVEYEKVCIDNGGIFKNKNCYKNGIKYYSESGFIEEIYKEKSKKLDSFYKKSLGEKVLNSYAP